VLLLNVGSLRGCNVSPEERVAGCLGECFAVSFLAEYFVCPFFCFMIVKVWLDDLPTEMWAYWHTGCENGAAARVFPVAIRGLFPRDSVGN